MAVQPLPNGYKCGTEKQQDVGVSTMSYKGVYKCRTEKPQYVVVIRLTLQRWEQMWDRETTRCGCKYDVMARLLEMSDKYGTEKQRDVVVSTKS